ncbi:MAG: hypothetical protein NTV30_10445 [Chloroflexi bacterium]|nr:hypothetical protein [Chloroflexota bacterium]
MLVTHPSILNVAIVAMPDPVMGEKACAYVILEPSQTLSFNQMTVYLLDKKIAKHKLPERLEIVENFPMSGDGQKVLKRELVADIVNKLKKEASYTI